MKALVVGGTGPTGPYIVNGLLERGYEVAIFHRGTHEIPEIPPEVEHIHGDPHFLETWPSSPTVGYASWLRPWSARSVVSSASVASPVTEAI